MNKVIITGHRQAGCRELEEILLGYGMGRPFPSLMQGLLPMEISEAMLHGSARQQREHVSERACRALAPGPIWKELLIDLLVANTEQLWWGWADPEFPPLLDYWRDMDPQTLFVLVYDEPHNVFKDVRDVGESTEVEFDAILNEKLDEWAACNRELLAFRRRNPERAILVSSTQARQSESAFANVVRHRLGLDQSLSLEIVDEECVLPDITSKNQDSGKQDLLEAAWNSWLAASGQRAGAQVDLLFPESVERLAITEYLAKKQPYLDLYQELQAASDMPVRTERLIPVVDAWKAIKTQRQCIVSTLRDATHRYLALSARHHDASKENESLRNQLHQLRVDLDSQYLRDLETIKKADDKIAKGEKDMIRLQGVNKELETLNRRSMEKHRKSEEQNEEYKSEIEKLKNILQMHGIMTGKESGARTVWPPTGAARIIKQELAYRLGAIIVSRSKSPIGLWGIPMAILRETRRSQQDRRLKHEVHLQSLRQYRDWDDACRIQGQLSYRLGKTLMEKSRSPIGWLTLPFALMQEVRAFRKRRELVDSGSDETGN